MPTFEESLESTGYREKLLHINRISKVVKGGRIFSFAALTIVGNGSGKVGFGYCKAKEVPTAISKSYEVAKKSMIDVELKNNTLHAAITAKHGASKIYLQPAAKGTGIIAGKAMRAVLECVGIQNILAKSYGSRNPINVVMATVKGLQAVESPRKASLRRNVSVLNYRLENE